MRTFKLIPILALLACAHSASAETTTPLGMGAKFTCQTSAPAPVNTNRMWIRCSDKAAIFTNSANVDRVFALTGAGGTLTLATSYINGVGTADSRISLDDTHKGVMIKDAASPITPSVGLGLFDVTNDAATSLFLDVTRNGINSFGPFAFGSNSYAAGTGNGWWFLANQTAATGGAPLQNAPEVVQEGKAWDGAASRTIGAVYTITAATTGASYTTDLKLTLKRNASFVTALQLTYDGTNAFLNTPKLNGALATGSTAIDLSGSTGAFKTSTGAVTIGPGAVAISGVVSATKDLGAGTFGLTDGATINTDCSNANTFTVTLGGNRTLANPTNVIAGHDYTWEITQDGTGNRTLAYGANFHWAGGSTPVLTTTASKMDMFTCKGGAGSVLYCALPAFNIAP